MRKVVPPILLLICLGVMGLLRWLWPVKVIFPFPYNLLGLVPLALGLLSGFLGIRQFRKVGTNIRPFKEADRLVTTGPYRYTRNPMYLGLALMLVGAWVLLGALTPVLGVLLFIIVADQGYIRAEEEMLSRKFGPAFEAYKARTRRWL